MRPNNALCCKFCRCYYLEETDSNRRVLDGNVNKMPSALHILIADDHDLFRRGLRYALTDSFADIRVSDADSLGQALDILAENPDIALASFDLRMSGMQEGRALQEVRRLYPALPIAVLSAQEGRQIILDTLGFGASGFIPKGLPAEDIVAALRDILDGRIYVPPTITALDRDDGAVFARAATDPQPPRKFDPNALTQRQREVFELMLAGKSTKEMARALDIAEGTVKIYLAAIFRLLDAHNRVEAVTKSLGLGFTPSPRATR
jgi:DNA-binding NarL/FixJ family response regulator